MQTDPNWGNFLYDAKTDTVQLIDFGASRQYTKEFIDSWFRLMRAASRGDRAAMKDESERIGYLVPDEGEEMVEAHLESMALVASEWYAHSKKNRTLTNRPIRP